MTAEPWVSVEDVAKRLGGAKYAVDRWFESRRLPALTGLMSRRGRDR